jgi:rod shape-determining protein MreC
MRFVPRRARNDISTGDIIISSGMGGIFPAGVNIGRVRSVNTLEYENTLEVDVIPMIDFSRLEYVFVIESESIIDENIERNRDNTINGTSGFIYGNNTGYNQRLKV